MKWQCASENDAIISMSKWYDENKESNKRTEGNDAYGERV
jgi:hypothetical protein